MQLGDRSAISDSSLTGYSVFDQQGYLLGQVLKVQTREDATFALVVQFPASKAEMSDLTIESEHITAIADSDRTINTDLDFNLVVPRSGKTIPLVAEQVKVRRQRHKVGEVVVRKVVATDWVQIPVHRETLLVEAVGQSEPLAKVDLGKTQVSGEAKVVTAPANNLSGTEQLGQWQSVSAALPDLNRLAADSTAAQPVGITLLLAGTPTKTVHMQFPSLQLAAQMLTTLSNDWEHVCQKIVLTR